MAQAKTATKVTKEEAAKMDSKKQGGTILPRPGAEVEGQYPYAARVICPWCGSVLNVIADTAYFKWFTCCVCGGSFKF